MKINFQTLYLILIGILLTNCKQGGKDEVGSAKAQADFIINDFNALTNYIPDSGDSIKQINLDYLDATYTGFIIPTISQVQNGNFVCRFHIQNNFGAAKKFKYK
ncbi:MAG: hypothetical protein ABI840_07435, partial [bacterium]